MSEEKKYTERDLILAKRDAWASGAALNSGPCYNDYYPRACRHYPLPKVERPREVRDPNDTAYVWSIRGGAFRFMHVSRCGEGDWLRPNGIEGGAFPPTPERIATWADLLANPTELVDAD